MYCMLAVLVLWIPVCLILNCLFLFFQSDDEVFKGFAERSCLHELKSYDRYCFKQQILNYHEARRKGMTKCLL